MGVAVVASPCYLKSGMSPSPSAAVGRWKKGPASRVAVVNKAAVESKPSELDCGSSQSTITSSPMSLAFVYGTLKRGFGNHWLMEEQMDSKHARFVGVAHTKDRYPLVCGPFQVPFLLNVPGQGEHVLGELYLVDGPCMQLMDELEGVTKRHYERLQLSLTGLEMDPSFRYSLQNGLMGLTSPQGHRLTDPFILPTEVQANVYFAHHHYTPGLLPSPHISAYTEKEAATYTRRIHRPQNRTFLEHIYHFIEQQQSVSAVE